MISLTNQTFSMLKQFRNEEKLWLYLQRQAQLEAFSQKAQGEKWGFTYYSHQMLEDFIEVIREKNFTDIVRQSVTQQQNMIVIHQGSRKNPHCCLVAPELDVVKLKRDWSKAFAEAHELILIME